MSMSGANGGAPSHSSSHSGPGPGGSPAHASYQNNDGVRGERGAKREIQDLGRSTFYVITDGGVTDETA